MIPRLPLSPSGPDLPRLVFGTWRLLDDAAPPSPDELAARLERAVELGMDAIDTAEIYGNYGVEELLGTALARSPGLRQKLRIITKCGIYVPTARHPDRKVAFYDASAARLVKSAEKSLRLLGTDHLDVLLVHRPDWFTAAEETAAGLDALIRAGKVRHVGVSNYGVEQVELLRAKLTAPLVTNQIELSLFNMGALFDGTLDQCQRIGIRPMTWSPLGGGRLFDPTDLVAMRVRAAMNELAPKYGDASPKQLALAWVLAHPSQPVVVFGTNKADRLPRIARAAELQLSRADWYALWEAAQGRRIP